MSSGRFYAFNPVIPGDLLDKLYGSMTRVGFFPEETYFFQDSGRNYVSSVFSRFLPEEMEET